MTAILTYLASNPWRSAAIGLGLLLAVGWGTYRVKEMVWTGKVERAEAALLVCKTNVTELTGALDRQNEALRAFQAAALAKQAEADRRAQEAKDRASRDRQREMGDDRVGAVFMNQWFESAF